MKQNHCPNSSSSTSFEDLSAGVDVSKAIRCRGWGRLGGYGREGMQILVHFVTDADTSNEYKMAPLDKGSGDGGGLSMPCKLVGD